jgi:hypothetical protein
VIGFRQVILFPTKDRRWGLIQDVNVTLAVSVGPSSNHGGGHDPPLTTQDVDPHGIASQLHTETGNVRQPQNEIELVKVDDNKRDLLLERLAYVQKYPHFALRLLKRAVAIQDPQVVGSLMHRKTMPPHKTGVDK